MRGIPDFNFPAFLEGAKELRRAGYWVFCPAEYEIEKNLDARGHDGDLNKFSNMTGFDLRKELAVDLDWICRYADKVVVLPGWESSRGAKAEVATAKALGLPVITLDDALGKDDNKPCISVHCSC